MLPALFAPGARPLVGVGLLRPLLLQDGGALGRLAVAFLDSVGGLSGPLVLAPLGALRTLRLSLPMEAFALVLTISGLLALVLASLVRIGLGALALIKSLALLDLSLMVRVLSLGLRQSISSTLNISIVYIVRSFVTVSYPPAPLPTVPFFHAPLTDRPLQPICHYRMLGKLTETQQAP